MVANLGRVSRLMRTDNLLAVGKRRFALTTDSPHGYAVYANLASRSTLTGLNTLGTMFPTLHTGGQTQAKTLEERPAPHRVSNAIQPTVRRPHQES